MQKLLIATSNLGKAGEYREHLQGLNLEFLSLKDLGLKAIDETGKTFEENAILKARTYFEKSGLPCVADDGGLEIDYLNGEPGIKSHRWIDGSESSDEELIAYTLKRLSGVPKEKRTARLRMVMAFADNTGAIHTTEASTEGIITEEASPNAKHGLPYRAILFIPEFGKIFADLTDEEQARLSQRVIAIKNLKPVIEASLA